MQEGVWEGGGGGGGSSAEVFTLAEWQVPMTGHSSVHFSSTLLVQLVQNDMLILVNRLPGISSGATATTGTPFPLHHFAPLLAPAPPLASLPIPSPFSSIIMNLKAAVHRGVESLCRLLLQGHKIAVELFKVVEEDPRWINTKPDLAFSKFNPDRWISAL